MKAKEKSHNPEKKKSIMIKAIPAGIIATGKPVITSLSSNLISTLIVGVNSSTKLPVNSFTGVAGIYGVAAGYVFAAVNTKLSTYKYGKAVPVLANLAVLCAATLLISYSSPWIILGAQFANALMLKYSKRKYGKEATLDASKNSKLIIYSNTITYLSNHLITYTLLPIASPLCAPVLLFNTFITCGIAERILVRKIADDNSVLNNPKLACTMLAANGLLASMSGWSLGTWMTNCLVESGKTFTHVALYEQKEKIADFFGGQKQPTKVKTRIVVNQSGNESIERKMAAPQKQSSWASCIRSKKISSDISGVSPKIKKVLSSARNTCSMLSVAA